MQILDYMILAVVALAVGLAIYKIRKGGGCCGGCSGSCGSCHTKDKK